MCSPKEKKPRQENEGLSSGPAKIKRKSDEFRAGNFPAIYIKIGAWQRMAKHEGHLVVKLYYATRKFVWEILEGPLKSKMEIQWSDICTIRAITRENEPGVLEIELIRPPVYYREKCPQPRRNTHWQQSSDFTDGQASIWRRHEVTFPPGILEKNYEKLLQYDKELNAFSKEPFPRHKSPYFDPTLFGTTLQFSGYGANKAAQYPYHAYPKVSSKEPLPFSETPNPSLSVLNLPFTYQGGRNNKFVAQNQGSWQQSLSIPRDNFGIHGTFGISSATMNLNNVFDLPLPSTTMNLNNVFDFPLHSTTNVNNVYDPSFLPTTNINNVYDPLLPPTINRNNAYDPLFPPTNDNNVQDPSHYDPNALGLLTGIQTDLLDNVQLGNALLEAGASTLLEPVGIVNSINGPSYQPDMAFHDITEDQGYYNNYDLNGTIPDPIHWLEDQGSSENMFKGSSQDAFQGVSDNIFEGAIDNVFHGTNDTIIHGANDNMFDFAGNDPANIEVGGFFDHGTNNNMFHGANDNMFDLAGNDPMNNGVGGFFDHGTNDNMFDLAGNDPLNIVGDFLDLYPF